MENYSQRTLIKTLLNKLKKSFLVLRQEKELILHNRLMIPMLLRHLPKNNWQLYLTLS